MSNILNAARNFHKKYASESPIVKYPFGDLRTSSQAIESVQSDLKNGVVLAPLVLGVTSAALLSAMALPAVGVAVVSMAVAGGLAGAALKGIFKKHEGSTLKAAFSDILDNTLTKFGLAQEGFKEKFESHPQGQQILNAYSPTMAERIIDKIRGIEAGSQKKVEKEGRQLGM